MRLPKLSELITDPDKLDKLTIPQLAALLDQTKTLTIGLGAKHKIPDNPADFAMKFSQGKWVCAPHLRLISDWLVALEAGDKKRILVSMPPRHGKSELISFWFPLWSLARDPTKKIILISYEAEFATSWGRRVRDAIRDFGSEMGLALNPGAIAAHAWQTTLGGGMSSVGAMGPITGKGADILIGDDLIKNDEEAVSETMREKLWDWWQTTAWTRLEPGGYAALLGTRWHEDDLIGRLDLKSQTGEGLAWDVTKIPAVAEQDDPLGRAPGQALWPFRFDELALKDIRLGMSPYKWSCLYQARPTPEEGNAVKRTWWKFYREPPAEMDMYLQSWDLAFKDMQDGSFTVGQVWGRKGAEFYLIHQVRERMNAPDMLAAIRNMTALYPRATAKIIEEKANGSAVIALLQKEVSGILGEKPKGSKDSRLGAVIPYIQAGNVYLPHPDIAPWVPDFVEEHAQFPKGANDDQVDASSQALRYLQPSAWAYNDKAARDAKHGPPPSTTMEIQSREFFKDTQKLIAKAGKAYNRSQRGILNGRFGR